MLQHQPSHNQHEAEEDAMTDDTDDSFAEALDDFRKAVETEGADADKIYEQRACRTCLHSCLSHDGRSYRIHCFYSPGSQVMVSPNLFCSQYQPMGLDMMSQRKEFGGIAARPEDAVYIRDLSSHFQKAAATP
jgi:hypothetical protein